MRYCFLHGRVLVLTLLLFTLMACVPQIQRPGEPVQTPRLEANRFIAADGEVLPTRIWLPEGETRSVIVAIHGFNDYSNAFAEVGTYLAQRGVAVYAYDQRGFGATRQRGIWPGADLLASDLHAFIGAVRAQYQTQPLYLLGESMGGAVAIVTMAASEAPPADRLILVAPAVWGGSSLNIIYRSLLWASAHTVPWLKVSGKGLKIKASDNYEMLKQMRDDPLVIKKTRIDALYGVVHLMDRAREAISELHTPTLVLYGNQDQVIPKKPVCRMLVEIPAPRSAAFYPEGYHMLLRDREAQRVWQDLVEWMQVPTKAFSSKTPAGCSPLLAEAAGKLS